ncbi:MAG: hypothetical protein FWH38_05365, partial [Treponema sp.]|nr:hypothetical protein [Treponema sp.]
MKVLSGFLAALLFFTAAGVFAQPGSAPDPDGDFMVTRTEHFEIYSSPDDALNIARKLEVRFAVYNQFFRFDPAKAVLPLRVKVFGDRELYNSYVESRLGTVPSEAVYLHYGQADQRELLLCQGGGNE